MKAKVKTRGQARLPKPMSALLMALALVSHASDTLSIDFAKFHAAVPPAVPQASSERLARWEALLARAYAPEVLDALDQINGFAHSNLRYELDIANYGESDYWATPLQTLIRGTGDCEDWAILQYISLRYLGVPEEHLRLIYVKATVTNNGVREQVAHMVLGYYGASSRDPLIIDSLTSTIKPASERKDLKPVFGFNASDVFAGAGPQGEKKFPNAMSRISRLRDIMLRMEEQGITIK